MLVSPSAEVLVIEGELVTVSRTLGETPRGDQPQFDFGQKRVRNAGVWGAGLFARGSPELFPPALRQSLSQ